MPLPRWVARMAISASTAVARAFINSNQKEIQRFLVKAARDYPKLKGRRFRFSELHKVMLLKSPQKFPSSTNDTNPLDPTIWIPNLIDSLRRLFPQFAEYFRPYYKRRKPWDYINPKNWSLKRIVLGPAQVMSELVKSMSQQKHQVTQKPPPQHQEEEPLDAESAFARARKFKGEDIFNPEESQDKKEEVRHRMTTEEAMRILGVHPSKPITPEELDKITIQLYEANDPAKGGSIYVQAKIVGARRILDESIKDGELKFNKPNEPTEKEKTKNSKKDQNQRN